MHALAAQLDDIGKPAWIGLTVASFILFWPLGLVLLGYLIGSGRMACRTNGSGDRWQRRRKADPRFVQMLCLPQTFHRQSGNHFREKPHPDAHLVAGDASVVQQQKGIQREPV